MPSGDINYKELRKEFEAFGGMLRDFCEHKKISYTYTSKKFAAQDKEAEEASIAKAKRALAKAAPAAADKLESLLNSSDEAISLKASRELLNKVGISSQVAAVHVINGNQTNIERVQVQFFLPQNNRRVVEAKVIENEKLEAHGEQS